MIDVIYLAAGQGKRAGLGFPKQFARLGGKPIMIHGLEVLQGMKEIRKIIMARPPQEQNDMLKAVWDYSQLQRFGINKAQLVDGGKTRQESVCKALDEVETEYVLVAEAVRPFITAEFVRRVINTEGVFVTPWMPAISTVLTLAGECLNREHVGEVQMPQKYRTDILRTAHRAGRLHNATDDAALVMFETPFKPILIRGDERNIKITTPLDLAVAEAIYNAKFVSEE